MQLQASRVREPARAARLKIGYVSPQTGPLASFATADNFVIDQIRNALSKGFTAGGKKRSIEIVVKDSQSSDDPRRPR